MKELFNYCLSKIPEEFCITEYDELLKSESLYSIHSELLPYIGKHYNKYRILCVGESHYLANQTEQSEKVDFNGWYSDSLFEKKFDNTNPLHNSFTSFFTRYVVFDHVVGKNNGAGYNMFSRPARACCEAFGCEQEKVWENLAFMNYYQRPVPLRGKSICAKEEDSKIARETLFCVCKAIMPKRIIFLSKKAYKEWLSAENEYESISFCVSHPTSFWWERKRKDGKTAKDDFICYVKQAIQN